MRNIFINCPTMDEKKAKLKRMIDNQIRDLHSNVRSLNNGTLSNFLKLGLCNPDSAASFIINDRLIEMIEASNKIMLMFNINEDGENTSKINITNCNLDSIDDWGEFLCGLEGNGNDGFCTFFMFNENHEDSHYWLIEDIETE